MVGMTEILTTDYADKLDNQAREYLSIITDCGNKARKMMEGLLHYVRITRDTAPFAQQNVQRILSTARDRLTSVIKASKAQIIEKSLPEEVYGEGSQLQMLFFHLLDNALKFHAKDAKPQIVISAEKRPDGLVFSISDNGIGIDEKYRNEVFNIYRRLHGDDDYPGVGIGLSIAKQIVLHHGGQIWCETNQPQRTIIRFTLPAHRG